MPDHSAQANRFRVVSGIAVFAIAIDLALKFVAHQSLPLCESIRYSDCSHVALIGNFALQRVENAGSALGFGQGLAAWTLLAAVCLGVIPLYFIRATVATRALSIGAGLQAGGAIANFGERLLGGGVTDFITYNGALTFNPADIFLVVGTLLAVGELALWQKPAPEQSSQNEEGLKQR